jgi:hypothetical protein
MRTAADGSVFDVEVVASSEVWNPKTAVFWTNSDAIGNVFAVELLTFAQTVDASCHVFEAELGFYCRAEWPRSRNILGTHSGRLESRKRNQNNDLEENP